MSQDKITLDVHERETVGKGLNKLRLSGNVPGVIHDHGKDSVVIQADSTAVTKAFLKAGKHHIVELKVGTKTYNAMIKDVSRDPRKNSITHIVFNAVKANEMVDAEVPVKSRLEGENESTPAERAGLIVLHNTESVEVEAYPRNLPDVLYYNGENLVTTGDQITVAELEVPEGVTVKTEETTVLATVFEPSALAAANDAAGGDAEPEDVADVESDHDSTAEEGTQADEQRPGGKKEYEDKEQGHSPTKQ